MRRPTGPLPSTGLPRSSSSSAASLSPLASLICRSLETYRTRRACSSRTNSYLEAKVANALVTAGGITVAERVGAPKKGANPALGAKQHAAKRKNRISTHGQVWGGNQRDRPYANPRILCDAASSCWFPSTPSGRPTYFINCLVRSDCDVYTPCGVLGRRRDVPPPYFLNIASHHPPSCEPSAPLPSSARSCMSRALMSTSDASPKADEAAWSTGREVN